MLFEYFNFNAVKVYQQPISASFHHLLCNIYLLRGPDRISRICNPFSFQKYPHSRNLIPLPIHSQIYWILYNCFRLEIHSKNHQSAQNHLLRLHNLLNMFWNLLLRWNQTYSGHFSRHWIFRTSFNQVWIKYRSLQISSIGWKFGILVHVQNRVLWYRSFNRTPNHFHFWTKWISTFRNSNAHCRTFIP